MALCLTATAAAELGSLGISRPRPQLEAVVRLRGGLEPRRAAAPSAAAAARSKKAASAAKKPPAPKGVSSVRDALSALAVLAVIGLAQLGSAPLVESLPKTAQGLGWMGCGGVFAASAYGVLRLLNQVRARALCDAMFGESQAESWLQHAVPALFFALGSAGAMLCLPEGGCQVREAPSPTHTRTRMLRHTTSSPALHAGMTAEEDDHDGDGERLRLQAPARHDLPARRGARPLQSRHLLARQPVSGGHQLGGGGACTRPRRGGTRVAPMMKRALRKHTPLRRARAGGKTARARVCPHNNPLNDPV